MERYFFNVTIRQLVSRRQLRWAGEEEKDDKQGNLLKRRNLPVMAGHKAVFTVGDSYQTSWTGQVNRSSDLTRKEEDDKEL